MKPACIFLRMIALLALAATHRPLVADDWPMYRNDVGRRGVTAEPLPDDLAVAWRRSLPELEPAFHNARLQFDAGYEPVVAGGRLLVASSLSDSVRACDAKTGQLVWTYYTDGPVRLAPAVWHDSVCFGSDDGCLYCLELATGKLRWKHRAAPSERRLLGNRRLISVWPVRGGPVVADGIVYFAAGVWPFEGVFVYALDVSSGDVVWRNDRLGYLFGKQPHDTHAIGGLAPQGYLLIDDDELIVPCSTAYPARINRHTGQLIEFELPSPGRYPGGWFAALDPDQARALRRGKLTFDEAINRQQHEDKVHKGRGGVEGLSRQIRAGDTVLKFDDELDGIDGKIHSMVFADGSLFVVTRDGRLTCLRARAEVDASKPVDLDLEVGPVPDADSSASPLVDLASSRHGIAIVAGLADGSLVHSLIRSSDYHVIAVDDDAARVQRLRRQLDRSGWYGARGAVIQADPDRLELPPYITTLLTSERSDVDLTRLLQTLRPYGGVAVGGSVEVAELKRQDPGKFVASETDDRTVVKRVGPLPGATQYEGDWTTSDDALVRFPLGVLWFDDTLAHFKRSPQPRFDQGAMISRPKDWHAPRQKGEYKTDYPLLPPVLSDIYTGRVLDESERPDLRRRLVATSPSVPEPSQYRPPKQKDAWKPGQPTAGQRLNPLTGNEEPRTFPKTYGCDGGVDYGGLYTLRAGTAAFYDKTAESGTVFLSGPRSGCTNSIIPSGGLLNVPYFYEGCTCSYPLPTAMSLVAMPERHEQWSAWGQRDIEPGSIQRLGINFGAPGDRITRDGTLWLDYPSVGGPSPEVRIDASPARYRYQHSLWIEGEAQYPWVGASAAEGLERVTIKDLKPGRYLVRLYFVELDEAEPGQRIQSIILQGQIVLQDLDIVGQANGPMRVYTREFADVQVAGDLELELVAVQGTTLISGIELIGDH